MRFTPLSCLLLAGLTLFGCAGKPTIKPDAANPIRTLALLPVVNNTLDLDGPVVVRSVLGAQLECFFYSVKPTEETDRVLRDQLGITLGSQLELASTRLLCEKLGVDGVVYGSLEDFNQKTTGIYNSKRVRLRVKLDNCRTGATVWKNGIGVKREATTTDSLLKKIPGAGNAASALGAVASVASSISDRNDTSLPKLHGEEIAAPWEDISEGNSSAEMNLALGLGGKIAGKALNSPLFSETEAAVQILLQGYFDDGADLIPHGTMCPAGPLPAPVKQAAPDKE